MQNKAEDSVLAVANAYLEKYYLNPRYQKLPTDVKQQIRALCIRFVEEAGGILEMGFNENGSLELTIHVADNDLLFDEIGAELIIKEYQREQEDLFRKLELYYVALLEK